MAKIMHECDTCGARVTKWDIDTYTRWINNKPYLFRITSCPKCFHIIETEKVKQNGGS